MECPCVHLAMQRTESRVINPRLTTMATPPSGDVTRIPADLSDRLGECDEKRRYLIEMLVASARVMHAWAGIAVRDLYIFAQLQKQLTDAENIALELQHMMPPRAWMSAHFGWADAKLGARQAEKDGWLTFSDGFAFPTQKLADFVCR